MTLNAKILLVSGEIQYIIELLQFTNNNFPNLKFITFNFGGDNNKLVYRSGLHPFDRSPYEITNIVNYEEQLPSYNGKAKVELNHNVYFGIWQTSQEVV